LRRDSAAALDTGYVSFMDATLDRFITENALNGTLYITALKYQPEWLLNWWHWLRASGVRTALVFACDETLLSFCEQTRHSGVWRLAAARAVRVCAIALTAARASSCAR
jgi:hypothetical protein